MLTQITFLGTITIFQNNTNLSGMVLCFYNLFNVWLNRQLDSQYISGMVLCFYNNTNLSDMVLCFYSLFNIWLNRQQLDSHSYFRIQSVVISHGMLYVIWKTCIIENE